MVYDAILQIEREITRLTQDAARVSIMGSHLGIKLVDGSYEIYCVWDDEEARQLYDNLLAMASERSVELAKLKRQLESSK